MSFSQQANITARICGPKLRGIEVNMPKNKETSVSVSEGTANVSTYLQPYICAVSPLYCFIEASIIKPDASPYFCKAESKNMLRWEYIVTFGRVDGIKIFFWHPPDACDWERTFVDSQFYGPILEAWPDGTGGEIISGENAYPFGQKEKSTAMLVNKLRPGEPIALTWRRTFAGWQHPGGSYFHGYNVTGGRVTAVVSPSSSDNPIYRVYTMGTIVELPSNDFYPYTVGEWVSVVFQNNNDDAQPGGEMSGTAFIVPLIAW